MSGWFSGGRFPKFPAVPASGTKVAGTDWPRARDAEGSADAQLRHVFARLRESASVLLVCSLEWFRRVGAVVFFPGWVQICLGGVCLRHAHQ